MIGRTYELPDTALGIRVSSYVRVTHTRYSGHQVHFERIGTGEPGHMQLARFRRKARPTYEPFAATTEHRAPDSPRV